VARRIDPDSRLWHLPAPLGFVLLIAGFSIVSSPRTVLLVLAAAVLIAGLVIVAAWLLRRRSGRPVQLTPAEESSDWQRFTASRRRWAGLESGCYVLIAAAVIWLDGLDLGTVLIAAGFGFLLVSRWLVEPRTWAEVTRRLSEPPT
jgi:purine-cytosine permease-like protein